MSGINSNISPSNLWSEFKLQANDIEFIFNHLLELEIPLTSDELAASLIEYKIKTYKDKLVKQSENTPYYLPKNMYKPGDKITFPQLDNVTGKVKGVRAGINPAFPELQVIEVELSNHQVKFFASNLANHLLNNPLKQDETDLDLDSAEVLEKHGNAISQAITRSLESNSDIIRIAGRWFPRSLLVDVNTGNLNLAEAILEEAHGGPITTRTIIEQAALPNNVNPKLVDFSLDLALQEDNRFDEVGPAGETLWFLKRLEPDGVQKIPRFLEYRPIEYSVEKVETYLKQFEGDSCDEYETFPAVTEPLESATIALIYPHWRAGTLPLTATLKGLFPTAFEAPKVLFTFVDNLTKNRFRGWVVRPHLYIYGLAGWYAEQGLIPGSLIHLKRSETPGEIEITIDKKRQNREELKTVLVSPDSGIEFKLLKQQVNASYNERLALSVLYPEEIDKIWSEGRYQKESIDRLVVTMMRELEKLTHKVLFMPRNCTQPSMSCGAVHQDW